MLPAAERLVGAREYITYGEYFVIHAPRQSGKSTSLLQLASQLTAEGEVAALYISCEVAEPLGDDYTAVENLLLDVLRREAAHSLPDDAQPPHEWPAAEAGSALLWALRAWVETCRRPLVLFLDEIDSIQGESLRSVLRQLRAGYNTARDRFVHSIALCGLRDVRDYKVASGGEEPRLGSASPFNIKVESIRLGDFTYDEVAALYGQHTAATGQEFSTRAIDLAYYYTKGQPWLTNALASEVIRRMKIAGTITDDHIDEAKERLILARATHLDSLVYKLTDTRVRQVLEPLLAGTELDVDDIYDDSVSYVRDLGLIAPGKTIRIANPIYNEVIVRVLTATLEHNIFVEPSAFRLPDGRLDLHKLLTEFIAFWKENGEIMLIKKGYHEAAVQLVVMAYLQRVVNGGGYIGREYGLGYKRVDLLVRQPYTDADGRRAWQREAIELKVRRDGEPDPLDDGLIQLDSYLDRLDLDHGTLAIFDRRSCAAPLAERTGYTDTTSPAGRKILLIRG
ncbi:ATP-binding protein [Nocardia stercoris]|uniref:ATP-binding protein n=2 Tax=Nocardia stercoris TaxID=2483361 RepID=A0A3M2LE80_9NOCA|nr:ATP-binding protein [Nocardia stercoris]